jgi:hypothetical protein
MMPSSQYEPGDVILNISWAEARYKKVARQSRATAKTNDGTKN